MNFNAMVTYLNDHLAMITGETELAQRTARENESTPLGMYLHRYVGELSEQKRCLEHLITALGREPSMAKQAAGWLLEKVGRLKQNDSWTKYSDLARLLELEMLASAAVARVRLWQSLKPHDTNPVFSKASGDFARFLTESQRHLDTLQEHHHDAARFALGEKSE